MAAPANEPHRQWGQIVAKAWTDESFKQRLLADPHAVLKEQGLAAPAGVQLRVVENTSQQIYLVLPPKPAADELSDEALEKVAGGVQGFNFGDPYICESMCPDNFPPLTITLPR